MKCTIANAVRSKILLQLVKASTQKYTWKGTLILYSIETSPSSSFARGSAVRNSLRHNPLSLSPPVQLVPSADYEQ
jgi:hypothetical protein